MSTANPTSLRPVDETKLFDLAYMQQRLEEQSFARLVGTRVTALSEHGCELTLPAREDLRQQHGFVHGGILCYLADNALTLAGFLAMRGNAITSEIKINYVRPAIGETVIARAHAVHAGRTQAVTRCDVFVVKDGEEKLCAVAQGTISQLSQPRS